MLKTYDNERISMELRDYQQRTVDRVLAEDTNSVIVLPTGSGKSMVIQKLVEEYHQQGKRVAVVVNRIALIEQLLSNLKSTGLRVSVVKAGMDLYSDTFDVVLIMEQSLNSSHNVKCDVMLRDEIHDGLRGDRFKSVYRQINPEKSIGLTATPVDENGVCLFKSYIEEATVETLIGDKYLCRPRYVVPKRSELMDYSQMATSGVDWTVNSIDMLLNTEEHNDFVVEQIMKYRGNRPTMVFAGSIRHAEAINMALVRNGIRSGVVHSKEENSDKTVRAFKSGRLDVIVNMSKLTTGFNHPATAMIVLVRPTKVWRLYTQIVGRGLRMSEGKDDCIVLDLAKGLSTHGFADIPVNFMEAHDKASAEIQRRKRAEDGVVDVSDGEVSREKLLIYNLKHKTIRVDELLAENEMLKIRLKQVVDSSSGFYDMKDNDNATPRDLVESANKYLKQHKLDGGCNSNTIELILADYKESNVDNGRKMSLLKNKLVKIVDGDNGYYQGRYGEQYKGLASMKTLFTWFESVN